MEQTSDITGGPARHALLSRRDRRRRRESRRALAALAACTAIFLGLLAVDLASKPHASALHGAAASAGHAP